MRILRANSDSPHTLAASFNIVSPMPNKAYMLNGYAAGRGTLSVSVDRVAGNMAVKFLCRVDDVDNMPMPATYVTTTGCTPLSQSATMADRFESNAVTSAALESEDPVPNSMKVPQIKYANFASYDNANNMIDSESRVFTPTPPVFNTKVSSKACLWLSFAEDSFFFNQAGDYGERVTEGYRPTTLLVPQGATQVRIEADRHDEWAHHPTTDRRSSAAGLTGDENKAPLVREDIYKASRVGLNSSQIDGTTAHPLNALVAVLDRGGSTVPTSVELIGLDKTLTLSPTTSRLFLGFHDSYEWSNNTDPANAFNRVRVKLTWS